MRLDRQDQIGILIIDTDRNNAINEDFIRESHEIMDEAEHDPGIQALVVLGDVLYNCTFSQNDSYFPLQASQPAPRTVSRLRVIA